MRDGTGQKINFILCRNVIRNVTVNETERSSLIYNTSARHERHECDTNATRLRH